MINIVYWENTDVLPVEKNLPLLHHFKTMRLIIMEEVQDEHVSKITKYGHFTPTKRIFHAE